MKFVVFDYVRGDIWDEAYATEEQALAAAEAEWDHLSAYDKKQREAFYVARCNEDGEVVDVIKSFK